ncbi:hypothetical protein KEM55_005680 [Ascosphaera atra]|nr:hypothetical protein KEM55_005680 [Ascosphaera atra]
MLPLPRKPFDPAVGGFPRHFTSLSAPLGPLNPASDPFVSTATGTSSTSTTGTGTGTTLSPTAPGFVPRSATLPSRTDGSPLSMSMAIDDAASGRVQGRRRDGSGSGRDGLGLTFGLGVDLDVDLGLRLSLDDEDDVGGNGNGTGSRRGSFKTIPNPRPWLHASLGPSAPPLPPPPPRITSLEMSSPAKTAFEDAESDERVFVIENLPADINYYALASLFDVRFPFPLSPFPWLY